MRLSLKFMGRMALAGFNSVGLNKFMTYPGSEYHDYFVKRGVIRYSDDYFLGLRLDARYRGYNVGGEFDPPWTLAQMQLITLFGYTMFYGLYYLSHPSRMLKTLRAVVRDEPSTRIEAILSQSLMGPLRRILHGGRSSGDSLPDRSTP